MITWQDHDSETSWASSSSATQHLYRDDDESFPGDDSSRQAVTRMTTQSDDQQTQLTVTIKTHPQSHTVSQTSNNSLIYTYLTQFILIFEAPTAEFETRFGIRLLTTLTTNSELRQAAYHRQTWLHQQNETHSSTTGITRCRQFTRLREWTMQYNYTSVLRVTTPHGGARSLAVTTDTMSVRLKWDLISQHQTDN